MIDLRSLGVFGLVASFLSGCAPEASLDLEDAELVDQESRPIIGGTPATDYPEAVLVDMARGGQLVSVCSGTMIAPRVVLTAGHCVHNYDGWRVTAPFAGGQVRHAVQALTYDWTTDHRFVNPAQHDVGLVILDGPIELETYPVVAEARVPWGTKVQNVGRIDDGELSYTGLFLGPEVAVQDGARYGYPLSYATTEIIESGDSGGPVFLPGPAPRTIVAVNSGSGGGIQVLARVDLLHTWIHETLGSADELPAPAPAPEDSCQGIDFAGVCQGSTAVWCQDGKLMSKDCAATGRSCGWVPADNVYECY
jgi:hypothetical protein